MADPECVEGATEVRIRRCVDDVWTEGWINVNEIGWGSAAVVATSGGCGGCPKKAALEAAVKLKWTADDLAKVLSALNGK